MSTRTAEEQTSADGSDRYSSAATEAGSFEDELRSLRAAIEDLRGQQGANDDQLRVVAAELASMRGFREHTETELSKLRIDISALASIVDEFAGLPADVRAQLEPELEDVRAQLQLQVRGRHTVETEPAADDPAEPAADQPAEPAADQPAEAAADRPVESEPESAKIEAGHQTTADTATDADSSTAADEAEPFTPPTFETADDAPPWLTTAIQRIAERRSARLAAELVTEVVPFHGLIVDRPLAYMLRIDELGSFTVHVGGGRATVSGGDVYGDSSLDFTLEGPAAAFASLAGGGSGSRFSGLRVRGKRRRASPLLKACRPPMRLARIADYGVTIWPGLLLAAMAEVIDPAWTLGSRFTVAYEIQSVPDGTVYVRADDGAPIEVTAVRSETEEVTSSLFLSERAFMSMVAGTGLPTGESALLSGAREPVESLLGWFAQSQGASLKVSTEVSGQPA